MARIREGQAGQGARAKKRRPSKAAQYRAAQNATIRNGISKVDPFSPNVRSTQQMGEDPASGLNKILNSGFPNSVMMPGVQNTSGADLIASLYAKVKKQRKQGKLAKGLPPLVNAANTKNVANGGAASIISPGSGLPTSSGQSIRAPKVSSKLNVDDSNAQKRAVNAAGIEYDPQIAAIRNLISSTNKTGKSNINEVGQMYGALEQSIRGDLPGVSKNYDDTQAKVAQTYANLQAEIAARSQGNQDATKAQLEQMGLGSAVADPNTSVNKGMTSDLAFLQGIVGSQAAGAAAQSEGQQLAAEDFTRGTAYRAAAQGATTKTQLMTDLADKILKLKSEKGSLVGTKAKAIRELTDQYKEEARAQAERDRAFRFDKTKFNYGVQMDKIALADKRAAEAADNELGQAKLAVDAKKAQTDAAKAAGTDFKSLDPWERAGVKANQLMGGNGDRAIAYLRNLINNNRNIQNGFTTVMVNGRPERVKITPERFAKLASQNAGVTGLPRGSINKIAAILWKEMGH